MSIIKKDNKSLSKKIPTKETIKTTITKEKKESSKEDSHQNFSEDLKNLWNEICQSCPKVEKITEQRKRKIKTRWKEHSNIEWWRNIFQKIEASDFCTGRNANSTWRASFDWIIVNDTNAIKVLEGKYDNKSRDKDIELDKYDRDPILKQKTIEKILNECIGFCKNDPSFADAPMCVLCKAKNLQPEVWARRDYD